MKKLQTFILIPVIILVLAAGGTAYAGSYIQNYRNAKDCWKLGIDISQIIHQVKDYWKSTVTTSVTISQAEGFLKYPATMWSTTPQAEKLRKSTVVTSSTIRTDVASTLSTSQ